MSEQIKFAPDLLCMDIEKLLSAKYIEWDRFKNSSFLVTGATGLIGSLVVRTLCNFRRRTDANIKIYAFVRSMEKFKQTYEHNDEIQVILGDIRDSIQIEHQIDYIIHAASVTNSKYMVTNPVETLMTSILGTENILRIAKEHTVKGMVFLSSMEVYGITTEDMNPITEGKLGYIDILNSRSSYSEGKRVCELLCASYAQEYGVPVKIARLAQVFGAGVSRSETKVYASFAKSAISGEDIVLHTDGEGMGNYCYTADAVGALFCLLTRGKAGEAYTVVNSKNSMKIKNMASLVAKNWGGKVVFEIPEENLYGYAPASCMELSGEKMEGLGWKAEVGLEDMYARMIKYWRQAK